jgi:putative photosynthetic complex assembly protein 2
MAVYDRSPRAKGFGFAGLTLLMCVAMGGILATRQSDEPLAVYVAFTCGAVIWGWQMASYYLGFVTGPKEEGAYLATPSHLPRQPQGMARRFQLALRASLYHELLVLGFGVLLFILTQPHANQWGLWSFVVLWLMHSSAKLNVFLGVRNFRIELLPAHLHPLNALLGKSAVNILFPFSVAAASLVALSLLSRLFASTIEPGHSVGLMLVSTMILLGVLEHWLLVLPLPATLWGWGIRSLPQAVSGDETELRRRMRALPEQMSES